MTDTQNLAHARGVTTCSDPHMPLRGKQAAPYLGICTREQAMTSLLVSEAAMIVETNIVMVNVAGLLWAAIMAPAIGMNTAFVRLYISQAKWHVVACI